MVRSQFTVSQYQGGHKHQTFPGKAGVLTSSGAISMAGGLVIHDSGSPADSASKIQTKVWGVWFLGQPHQPRRTVIIWVHGFEACQQWCKETKNRQSKAFPLTLGLLAGPSTQWLCATCAGGRSGSELHFFLN